MKCTDLQCTVGQVWTSLFICLTDHYGPGQMLPSPGEVLCVPSFSHSPPSQPSFLTSDQICLNGVSCNIMRQYSHTTDVLLVSFQCSDFEINPCCYLPSKFTHFYYQIIFSCVIILQFVYPFTCSWKFGLFQDFEPS